MKFPVYFLETFIQETSETKQDWRKSSSKEQKWQRSNPSSTQFQICKFFSKNKADCQVFFFQATTENNLILNESSHQAQNDISSMTDADWVIIRQVQHAYSESIVLNKVIGVPQYPAT